MHQVPFMRSIMSIKLNRSLGAYYKCKQTYTHENNKKHYHNGNNKKTAALVEYSE